MGHYWRDMYPNEADEQDKRIACATECRAIQDRLRECRSSFFTVGEIGDILYALEFKHDNSNLLTRLKRIEEKVKR